MDINELHILLTLASIHWIALMSPGPDFALIVQNTTHHGRKTGLTIAAGLSCGILIHSILSITGVSFLIQKTPLLFMGLQICSAAYLFYLGMKILINVAKHWRGRHQIEPDKMSLRIIQNKEQAFTKGLMTNLLNPKALIFFISIMSTWVPSDISNTGKTSIVITMWLLAFIWFSLLAWLLSTQKLQKKLTSAAIYIDLICGCIFNLLSLFILFEVFQKI